MKFIYAFRREDGGAELLNLNHVRLIRDNGKFVTVYLYDDTPPQDYEGDLDQWQLALNTANFVVKT